MVAARLTRALKAAGIPIVGVSIGRPGDRSTWRIDYAPEATAAQRTAGEALKASFDPDAVDVLAAEKDAEATRIADDVLIRALARATWEELQKCQPKNGQTLLDLQGFRDRVKAIVRNLLT
jgi:hypothetical protein